MHAEKCMRKSIKYKLLQKMCKMHASIKYASEKQAQKMESTTASEASERNGNTTEKILRFPASKYSGRLHCNIALRHPLVCALGKL